MFVVVVDVVAGFVGYVLMGVLDDVVLVDFGIVVGLLDVGLVVVVVVEVELGLMVVELLDDGVELLKVVVSLGVLKDPLEMLLL